QLYAAYQKWCDANVERVLSQKTFANYLSQHQEKLGIRYRKNIPVRMNQTARGYEGIHVMVRDEF
ncbi:MAG: DNA primase, partial [Parasporobacterium sp.]|nr:DNA primase [Parasporobacterium sp.]